MRERGERGDRMGEGREGDMDRGREGREGEGR